MDRFLGPVGKDEQPTSFDIGTSLDQGNDDPETKVRTFLKDVVGLDDTTADAAMANEKLQDAFFQAYARKSTGKEMSVEEVAQWLPEHVKQYAPLFASRNRSLNQMGTHFAKEDDKAFRKGAGNSNSVRDRIKQGLPQELHHLVDALDDKGISRLANKQLESGIEAQEQGGIGYRDVEGSPRLKIVQDDAFLRAGYKSGDTVCVKIP